MKSLKLIDKSKLLVFFLCIYMYCGVCEAIESNLLPIFIHTENGKKCLSIDGLEIEKHQGRTITVENAKALVEYNITNLNLQNLNFDPGALLIILNGFNEGYLTFKNCHLDKDGFLVLLDYYIQKKKIGKIIFGPVGVEFMLGNVLQQIDLTTISCDSATEEKIRQIVLWLFINGSKNISSVVLKWLNESRTLGNNRSVIATPPLPLTIEEEERTRARRLQPDVKEEQVNPSSSATASTLLPVQEIPKNNIMQRNETVTTRGSLSALQGAVATQCSLQ